MPHTAIMQANPFKVILDSTACVFASKSSVVTVPLDLNEQQFSLSLLYVFSRFKEFNREIETSELDAFVIEIRDVAQIKTIEDLKSITKKILFSLAEHDQCAQAAERLIAEAPNNGWWYVFDKNRYLPSVFSHLYSNQSPRHTYGQQVTFIMFQPVQSFDRKATPKGTEISESVRELIRQKYRQQGCPYNEELVKSYYEGLKVIEGIPSSSIVEWWL